MMFSWDCRWHPMYKIVFTRPFVDIWDPRYAAPSSLLKSILLLMTYGIVELIRYLEFPLEMKSKA